MNQTPPLRRLPRRGFTLIEAIVASVVLSAAFLVTTGGLTQLQNVRRDLSDRDRALREARNLCERMLAGEQTESLVLSDETARRLEAPELGWDVAPALEHGLRQATVTLSWLNASGRRARPVALTVWVPEEEAQP